MSLHISKGNFLFSTQACSCVDRPLCENLSQEINNSYSLILSIGTSFDQLNIFLFKGYIVLNS